MGQARYTSTNMSEKKHIISPRERGGTFQLSEEQVAARDARRASEKAAADRHTEQHLRAKEENDRAKKYLDIAKTVTENGYWHYVQEIMDEPQPLEELRKLPLSAINRLIYRWVATQPEKHGMDEEHPPLHEKKRRAFKHLLTQIAIETPDTAPIAHDALEDRLTAHLIEADALQRSREEHERARKATTNALASNSIPQFIDAIKTCLRPPILTGLEKSMVKAHLEKILASKDAYAGRLPSKADANMLAIFEQMTAHTPHPDYLDTPLARVQHAQPSEDHQAAIPEAEPPRQSAQPQSFADRIWKFLKDI